MSSDQPGRTSFEQTQVLQLLTAGVLAVVLVGWILLATVFANL